LSRSTDEAIEKYQDAMTAKLHLLKPTKEAQLLITQVGLKSGKMLGGWARAN